MGLSWELEGDETEWGSLWGGAALTNLPLGELLGGPVPFSLALFSGVKLFLNSDKASQLPLNILLPLQTRKAICKRLWLGMTRGPERITVLLEWVSG